tara:strand:+ start:1999 stop:2400 length:402 start_codon:yes stop_codon:yes gene_type:complete
MNDVESKTEKAIRQAIVRIKNGKSKVVEVGTKMSFSAVAKEASVDRRTIDLYPKLRERIEGEVSSKKRKDATEKQKELTKVREKLATERKVVKQQKELLQSMASRMATLELENQELRAKNASGNVAELSRVKR